MILAVDEVGYADAVEAFRSANLAAATITSRLASDLSGTAAMAGTDSGASDFAAAYDAAAGTVSHALSDATRALATLGRTTALCGARHAESERAAIIPGGIVDPGCLPTPTDSWLTPLPATPPSSLGGDSPALTAQENWILDQVGGILWPDGNPTRLRTAAAAWRRAGESLTGLAATCAVAGDALATQRSPEIPLAIAACDELGSVVLDLADQCAALATQCEAYADSIDTAHAALRALLTEILLMVVEGMVVSAVLGAVSLGAGAAAGTAAIAVRIAAKAPRFHHILNLLKAARTGYTAALRTTHSATAAAHTRLTRFLRVPARGERGAFQVMPGGPRSRVGELLRRSEGPRGHTLARHVGMSHDKLAQRFESNPKLPFASTFDNAASAERHIEAALRTKVDDIERWLQGEKPRERFDCPLTERTGISMSPSGDVADVQGVRLVLDRDASMPDGYRIVTAFPQP